MTDRNYALAVLIYTSRYSWQTFEIKRERVIDILIYTVIKILIRRIHKND